MSNSSTNVENPVNQIANLLEVEDAEQSKVEKPKAAEEMLDESQAPLDESQPQE